MDLRELQLIEKSILKSVIEVCRQLDINYFLISGSMLGAVRHNGFIPWDDDIDIALPRSDYNKFIKFAQDLLPEYYFLQTHQTDPEYFCSFAKVRDSRTTFVERSLMLKKINHGVYIDVFPLDGFPESKYEKMIFLFKNRLYTLRLSKENYSQHRSTKWRIASTLATIINPSVEKTWKKRDFLYQSIPYENAKFVSNLGNAWGKKEVMDKSVFRSSITKMFEGMEVNIPIDFDVYLKKLYGDYMSLPKVEDRIPHHFCLLCDLQNSFTDNSEHIQNLIRKELQS